MLPVTERVHPVILFDGVCNLCNASVRFVVRRDPGKVFRFAPLQSVAAVRLLEGAGLSPGRVDTVVLVDGGVAYTRSTAALRIARRLRFPWPLLYAFVVVPRPLRDAAYRFVARRRYRWFGRRDECMVPRPGDADRFLV